MLIQVYQSQAHTLKYRIKVHVRSINFGEFFHPVWPYSILYVDYLLTFTTQENQNHVGKRNLKIELAKVFATFYSRKPKSSNFVQ